MSRFDTERRAKAGDGVALKILQRESSVSDLMTIQRVIIAILTVGIAVTAVSQWGTVIGALIAIVIVLSYGLVSQRAFVNALVQKRYVSIEPRLMKWIQSAPVAFSVLRTTTSEQANDPALASREQLLHLVKQSHGILTNKEKMRIEYGLAFSTLRVSDIMTPRSAIHSVASTELLGPLVLDELHKTGHILFPVIEKDLDHIVGILNIERLLNVSSKESVVARDAMDPAVQNINESQTLDHALILFLKTHSYLLVVTSKNDETAGVLLLEDVIGQLTGEWITDAMDATDDFASAAHNSRR
jgi:CBS domain containing-hemolysin-like protein